MRPFLRHSFCFSFLFFFFLYLHSRFLFEMEERRKLSSERHHLIVEIIEAFLMEI